MINILIIIGSIIGAACCVALVIYIAVIDPVLNKVDKINNNEEV